MWFETGIPGQIRDFPVRSRAVPHIQGCGQIFQGQSHREFVPEGLYNENKAEAIIQGWQHDKEFAEECRKLVDSVKSYERTAKELWGDTSVINFNNL